MMTNDYLEEQKQKFMNLYGMGDLSGATKNIIVNIIDDYQKLINDNNDAYQEGYDQGIIDGQNDYRKILGEN